MEKYEVTKMSLVKKNPSNLNRIIKGTKYSEAFMGKPTDEQRVIIENANANNMVIAAPDLESHSR